MTPAGKRGRPRQLPVAHDASAPDRDLPTCSPALRALLEHLRTKMHLPDADYVIAEKAAVATSFLKNEDPLWLLLVGASSSGKTEAMNTDEQTADHYTDELSGPAALLCWKKVGTGKDAVQVPSGILSSIPDPGLLIVSDLSTTLAMSDRGTRDVLFSDLRVIYDGKFTRDQALGTLSWSGRLTIVAGCTHAIDNYSAFLNALGPRFMFFRVPPQLAGQMRTVGARAAAAEDVDAWRTEAQRLSEVAVAEAAERIETVEVDDELQQFIVEHAVVTCYGRAAVPRDGYGRREITGLADVEMPGRVTKQLVLFARGLLALGLDDDGVRRLVRECALGSMPRTRRYVLEALATADGEVTAAAVGKDAGIDRKLARWALEEMEAAGIVHGRRNSRTDEEEDDTRLPRYWSFAATGDGPEVLNTLRRWE